MPNLSIKELADSLSKVNSILFSINVNFLSSVPVPVKSSKDFKSGEYYLSPVVMEKITKNYDKIESELKKAKGIFSSILPDLKLYAKNPKLFNTAREVFDNLFQSKKDIVSGDLGRKKYALFTLTTQINSLINYLHVLENSIFAKFQSECIGVFEAVVSKIKLCFNAYLFLKNDHSKIKTIEELVDEIKNKISSLVYMYDPSLYTLASKEVFLYGFNTRNYDLKAAIGKIKKYEWKKLSASNKDWELLLFIREFSSYVRFVFMAMRKLSFFGRFEYPLKMQENEIMNLLKTKESSPFRSAEEISKQADIKLFTNLRNDFEKALARFKDEYYTIFTESYHLGYANEFFSSRIEELKSRAQAIVTACNSGEIKQKYDYVLYDFSHNILPLLQRKITIFNFAEFVKSLNDFLFFGSDLRPSLTSFLNKFIFRKVGMGEVMTEALNPNFQINKIKERVQGLNIFSFEIAQVYAKLKYASKKGDVESLVNRLFDLLNGFKMQFEAILRACDLFDRYKSVRDDFNNIIFFIRDKKKGIKETDNLQKFVYDVLFRLQERYDIVVLVHIKEIIDDKILVELHLKEEVVFDPKLLTKFEYLEDRLEKLKKSLAELRLEGASFLSESQVKTIGSSLTALNGQKENLKKENVPILTIAVVKSILRILDILLNLFKFDYSNALNIPVVVEKQYKHYGEVMDEIYAFVSQKNRADFSKLLADFNLSYKKSKLAVDSSMRQIGVLDRTIYDKVSAARSSFISNPNNLYSCADIIYSLLSPSPRKLSLLELRANYVNAPSRQYFEFLKEINVVLTKALELTRK